MDSYTLLFITAVLFVLIVIKGRADDRKRQQRLEKKLRENYGKKIRREYDALEYDLLSHFFRNKGTGEGLVIDDISWNDLDMDNFYMSMNYTQSQTGEEYLFDLLHRPVTDEDVLQKRGKLIRFFEENEEERLKCQKALAAMGRTKKYSLTDYLQRLGEIREENNILHLSCVLLGIVSISMIFIKASVGFVLMLIATAFNVATYFRRKSEIDPYISCFAYIVRTIRESKAILNLKAEETSEYTDRLKKALDSLASLNKSVFWLVSGRNLTGSLMELPLDYIRIFFHLDLIRFNEMLRDIKLHKNDVYEMIETVGLLDSAIAIGHFRKTLGCYTEPQFDNGANTHLSVEGLFHPLLLKPVACDIDADRGVLVTGSNASGKSTFLKSAALAVVMAETIYTVAAKKCQMSFFEIYSSMSIRDSISAGDSYYMAEIRAMKRIMDAAKVREGVALICFVDEILRGTNTVERIAASSELLKVLSKDKVLCFAATHDYELTYMLESYMDNYHFSETIVDGNISFDYKLETGRAESRDAIRLLDMIGYDASITEAAFATSNKFIETGVWPKL